MKLSTSSYVPSLRIRAAELQALKEFTPDQTSRVCPLFTLPPIEFNFETGEEKTDIDTHVERRIKTIQNNWAGEHCWIDVHPSVRNDRLKNNKSIISRLVSSLTSEDLLGQTREFIPVLSLNDSKDISEDIFQLARSDENLGFGLKVLLDDLVSQELKSSIQTVICESGLSPNVVDLILDLEAPTNFLPIKVFASSINNRLDDILQKLKFRNVVLISTSIPETYSSQGSTPTLYPRNDWKLYREILDNHPNRDLIFGDYTIVHPRWNADHDMRKMKAPAKLIYALDNEWLTRKGTAFHSDPSQMHTICSEIVNSGYFKGAGFSKGSKYIQECAEYREQPSNLTRWKRVAINHHMTVVLYDLSTLHASP